MKKIFDNTVYHNNAQADILCFMFLMEVFELKIKDIFLGLDRFHSGRSLLSVILLLSFYYLGIKISGNILMNMPKLFHINWLAPRFPE